MGTITNERYALSFGVLKDILNGEILDDVILQILGYKQIPGSNNARFRLLLNDGVVLFPYAILATQLNNLIYDNRLEKYTIFKLKNYAFSQLIVNKKVIICIDIEILVPGSEVSCKISASNASLSGSVSNLNDSSSMSLIPTCNHTVGNSHPGTSDIAQNWDTAQTNTVALNNSKVTTDICISPISSLSPYRRKWTIKARVSYKTPLIKYNKIQEQGKYFSFNLLDDSGEIRATAFNENAEKFHHFLEVFKIYFISNGEVKRAPQNDLMKCDFEILIENCTKIEPYTGLISSIPMPTFNFRSISQIVSLPKDSSVDVIGICHQISDISVIMTKVTNKEIFKRNISLIDNSKKTVTVTLWNAYAENFAVTGNHHVIAIKNVKITNYGGFSLNTSCRSMVYIDPNIDKAFQLKSWFQTFNPVLLQSVSSSNSCEASQNWKTFAEVFTELSSSVDRPLYYTVKATIITVKKEKCLYQACLSPGCFKKVIDLNNGLYRCNKCNLNSGTFNWALCLFLEVADFTGNHWITAFQEIAENLINMSCDELYKIKSENKEKYYDILNNLNLEVYAFKMRSHFEAYNEDKCLKTTILNFSSVEPISYTKMLLTDIKRMSRILNATS